MIPDRIRVLLDTVTRLYHKQTLPHLENLLQKTSEADLHALFKLMSHEESARIFPLLGREIAARILLSLRIEDRVRVAEVAEVREILPILEELSSDEQQAIVSRIKGVNRNPLNAAIAIRRNVQAANMMDDSMMGLDESGQQESYVSAAAPGSALEPSGARKPVAFDPERIRMLKETILQFHEKKATRTLQRIFVKVHPADLANAFEMFPEETITEIFLLIPDTTRGAKILSELKPDLQTRIVSEADMHAILPFLEKMAPDNQADLLSALDKEVAQRLIDHMDKEIKNEIENLLQYPAGSAGSLMTSQFFALPEDTLVSEAIAAVRTLPTYEMVFYLYVVDESGRLIGVSSLRQLLLANPNAALREIMNNRVLKSYTHTPSSEVADLARHYRILGIPVVDEMGVMVGLITMDDLFPVIEEDTTDSIYRMAGTDSAEMDAESSLPIVRIRLPGMLAVFLGGLLGVGIIAFFQHAILEMISLIFFLPIVMTLSSNIGAQSATVVVRSLSTGLIKPNDFGEVILREVGVGVIMGLAGGIPLGLAAYLLFGNIDLVQVVSMAMLLNASLATLFASAIPIILEWRGKDPTALTGPQLTTTLNIISIASYFVLAHYFVQHAQ
ncbi:MAG: magnesium transporter [Magnetococcales bacterium]|nr:magnesium transporter [Magnetococcales bacterium]